MKKILSMLAILLALGGSAYAQNAALSITNNTDYTLKITFYAHDASSTACGAYASHLVTLSPHTSISSLTLTDPCAFNSVCGWATGVPSFCPAATMATTFQWDYADYTLYECAGPWSATVGDVGTLCGLSNTAGPVMDCTIWHLAAQWGPASGSVLSDVSFTINQY